ncbi:Nitroreductase [Spiroplasma clarkii]|uniref:Nitroreductase n=1 Tax=Spiroplasma clarkii TaxID=2139 RepID=A0A1Y0L380_9MOLU|nr:nitroreductase family protein [Spiroplasma clarkii]ARU92175.1 Nitroreductase [Spiroplasma clarkii]ATX71506.1 nitroreductase [Spiroplasma clarkii]
MSKTLDYIKKRRSPKKYIVDYKLTTTEVEEILESIRWAPSSVGLEPYRVIYLENKAIREELKEFCWNQPGTVDASAMIIWLGYKADFVKNKVMPEQNDRNVPVDFEKAKQYRINAYNNVIEGYAITNEEFVARQAYISLGCALVTAEEIGIDFCPVEGMEPRKIEAVLQKHQLIDLNNEFVCVAAFVGKVDKNQRHYHAFDKIRRPETDVYKVIK